MEYGRFKQFGITISVALLKGVEYIARPFFYFLRLVARPFVAVLRFFYYAIILNSYSLILRLTGTVGTLLAPVKNKYLYPLLNKYFTHVLMIVLVCCVVATNVQAEGTRSESFGEKSMLFALVQGSDQELSYIEEAATIEPVSSSYTEIGAVSHPLAVNPNADIDIMEDQLSTTQGGTALIKPNVSSSAQTQTRTRTIDYIVKEGDSLSTIAQQYALSPNTILWANNLASRDMIRAGITIHIPPADGILVTVKSGDTLRSIAKKYQGDVDKIIAFNRLVNEQDIQAGMQLMIPEGKQYYAPAPVQPKPQTPRIAEVGKLLDAPSPTASGKMLWPTTARRLSQYFSWKHPGVDIDGDFGDPVWAADDGVVFEAFCQQRGYGCHVIIDHGGGRMTLYGHFQKILVEKGETVKRGQLIGEEGSTGWSTGAHVHFEVRINGKRYNPLSYIR